MIVSNSILENGQLDKVWFVVTPQNPLKNKDNILHQFDRFDLVKRAISHHSKLSVSDIEFYMPQPNYTIHTLTSLTKSFPHKNFILIMGSDNMKNFPKWKNHLLILEQYKIYVYPRFNNTDFLDYNHPHITWIKAPLLNISATYIREAIKNNKSIKHLVPECVEYLIRMKNFYL